MKKLRYLLPLILVILLLTAVSAVAEEAENLTEGCTVKAVNAKNVVRITDGKYTTYWESGKTKKPWVTVSSDKPIYGLYLCFQKLPDTYEIQKASGDDWITVAEGGNPRYHHAFFELDGVKKVRIISTMEKANSMGFNEIFIFGKGEVPEWVQRWQEPVEKADLLFMIAHPDDELLFTGGAIPTYAAEKGLKVEVVYLTHSNTTRRSEALNGLWAMGVRNYPVFGPFADRYSNGKTIAAKATAAYKAAGGKQKVLDWVNELFRRFKPEVVVTHGEKGEYGHAQHILMADASMKCFTLAADPAESPESAQQYGTWQVKKLYLHQQSKEGDETVLDWNEPLEAFDGKTGAQMASEAFALHASQKGMGVGKGKSFKAFTVETTGAVDYPYDHFVLQNTTVGPDEAKDDFMEHIDTEEAEPEKEPKDKQDDNTAEDNEPAEDGKPSDDKRSEKDGKQPDEETGDEDTESTEVTEETEPEAETEEDLKSDEEKLSVKVSSGRFKDVTPPAWANVKLNADGFLDEGEYVFADEEEGHYIYVSSSIRVQIERTYVTYEKELKKDSPQEFYLFAADIWCDLDAGEVPHTVNSNPDNPRKDPAFIKDIAAEQKIVFATSTDYYTYRSGRAKEDKSRHVGIEIRNGEVIFDDPMLKEEQMPNYETLALNRDGTAESYPSKDRSAEEYLKNGAMEVFTFGPCLVRNGKLTEYIATANRSNNPRLAIGVAEPGHYVVVLCEGRVGKSATMKRSTGVMMKNLAQIMLDKGCTVAVNMDGGQTAVFAFMGKQINRVVKSDPKGRKQVEALAFGTSEQVGVFELEGVKFKK